MFYTISAAAKKLNISAHTLRYYDKEGLLPFIERNEKGIRIFQEKDFEITYDFQNDLNGIDLTVTYKNKTFGIASYVATKKSIFFSKKVKIFFI